MRDLRVLHVYCGVFPSSQGTQILVGQTIEACRNLGYDTRLLCFGSRAGDAPHKSIERVSLPGIRTPERSGPSWNRVILDLRMITALRKLLLEFSPDIVHAHHYEALAVARLADISSRSPIVFHQHSLFEPELPTYTSARYLTLLEKTGRAIDRFFPRAAQIIIALSDENRKRLILSGIEPSSVHTIFPPAEPPPAVPALLDSPQKHITGVYVGNTDEYQGLGALFRAYRELPDSISDVLRLKLVTTNPLIENVPCGIEVIPHGTYENALSIIQKADFMVIPRAISGGIPIKMMNAFSVGLPVLVDRNVAGMLTDDDALLMDAGKPENIQEALVRIVSDKELRHRLAKRSKWLAENRFAFNEFQRLLGRVYRQFEPSNNPN